MPATFDEPKLIAQLEREVQRMFWHYRYGEQKTNEEARANLELIQKCSAALEREPLREGEFVRIGDRYERAAHIWGCPADGIDGVYRFQPGINGCGRSFLGEGWTSFSGSLGDKIELNLRFTGEYREGRMWLFHRGHTEAHRGVDFDMPLRVFEAIEKGEPQRGNDKEQVSGRMDLQRV